MKNSRIFRNLKIRKITKEYVNVLSDLQYYKELIPDLKLEVQEDESLSRSEKFEQLTDIDKALDFLTSIQDSLIELARTLYGIEIQKIEVNHD